MTKNAYKRFGIPGNHALGVVARARRREILETVRAVREGTRPEPKRLKTARLALSIPELDYYVILERFPDLKSPDPEIRRKAWIKFYNDPRSEIYRVSKAKE